MKENNVMSCAFYHSPVGIWKLVEENEAICVMQLAQEKANIIAPTTPLLKEACRQLDAYFAGKLKKFDLPLAPQGTKFQLMVWQQLQNIGYGETISYQQLAQRCGNIKACRAVGQANNRNPIAIIIPCHRVIGKNGALIGYAGGISIKQYLLELEQRWS